MVSTIKFSQFSDGGDLENSNITVGLESSSNVQFNNPWTFLPPGTTGDRPVPAPSNYYRLRFNTTLEAYEFYDPVSVAWVQIEDSGDIQDLIDRLAAHTAGDGASMIGLQNQGTVLNKTVQDFANATLIAQTDNGTLANGQFLDLLSDGVFYNVGGVMNADINFTTDGSGNVSIMGSLQVDNLHLNGNTLSSTDANGNITYSPNGTGVNFFTKDIQLESNSSTITLFSPDLLRTSYTTLTDLPTTFQVIKTSASGAALVGISPIPTDGTSDARVRFFRNTVTTSPNTGLQIHFGDGTMSQQSFIGANSDTYLNALAGNVGIGFPSAPNSKLEVRSDSSGTTTEVIRLTNGIASAINTGVSLSFQPNNESNRAASIRSLQTTAGNYADLKFYVANAAEPALAMTINAGRRVDFTNGISFNAGTNILSSYVSRTAWTPVFTFATPGDLALSAVSATAWYIRIGDLVTVLCDYTFTATFTTSAGNAQLTGFPIAAVAGQGVARVSVFFGDNVTYPAGTTTIFINLAGSLTLSTFAAAGSGASAPLTTANFTSGAANTLRFVLQYYVA